MHLILSGTCLLFIALVTRTNIVNYFCQIGLLGLVELGWMETLSTIEMEEIDYQDYVESADKYGNIYFRLPWEN